MFFLRRSLSRSLAFPAAYYGSMFSAARLILDRALSADWSHLSPGSDPDSFVSTEPGQILITLTSFLVGKRGLCPRLITIVRHSTQYFSTWKRERSRDFTWQKRTCCDRVDAHTRPFVGDLVRVGVGVHRGCGTSAARG